MKEEIIELTKKLISIPSVTGDKKNNERSKPEIHSTNATFRSIFLSLFGPILFSSKLPIL